MPTPDDAMPSPSPAEHESHLANRATCPPEESRIHASRDATGEQSFHSDSNIESSLAPRTQQPTPPPAAQDLTAHSQSPSRPKGIESEIETPIRDIPTPLSGTDETSEEQRNPHVSPLSVTAATTPAPVSWHQSTIVMSPFPSQRVCTTIDHQLHIM